MTIDFDAFNAEILTDDLSGVDATYTPTGGQAVAIRACFTLGVEDITLGGDVLPQGVIGHAGCASSDVEGAKNGDTFEVNDVSYRILKIQPDETGWTKLFLGKRY